MRGRLRWWLVPFALAIAYVIWPTQSHAGFLQTQRAQRFVTITVNVTPGPYGYRPAGSPATLEIALAHKRGRGAEREELIAQASAQHAVPVEANVTPDPTAALFGVNPNSVTVNVQAGNSVTLPCAYQVNITTTVGLWTVDTGLATDFSPGFNGTTLAHNSYIATPRPTATPFSVYPDNNNAWGIMDKNGGTKIYCVDLTLNVPITVLGGVYTTTAVYTLYY
jgi:hypothetical protein